MNLIEIKKDLESLLLSLGEILRGGYVSRDKDVSYKSGVNDLLTKYDIEINNRILKHLGEKYPDVGIISEESPEIKRDSKYCFVIDPIDGTRNFVRNIPLFYIGIALVEDNKSILSLTYNPIAGELFWAIKGEGAYMNEKKILVSDNKLEKSDVTVRYAGDIIKQGNMLSEISKKIHIVRNTYCMHNDIASVSCMRTDGLIHKGAKKWDYCQYLLVEEAGGKVTDWEGNEYDISKDNIVASNGIIHDVLLNTVKD